MTGGSTGARQALRDFARAGGGNVLTLFAFALVPLLGLTGAAIDYARASSLRTELQAAVDIAAVAVARDAVTLSEEQIRSKGQTYFNANFHGRGVTRLKVVTSVQRIGTGRVVMKATGTVENAFMKMFGAGTMEIGAEGVANAPWGVRPAGEAKRTDQLEALRRSARLPQGLTPEMLRDLTAFAKAQGQGGSLPATFGRGVDLD